MDELDLFAAAIAITDPGERAALLKRECTGRPDVRNRLDQLLDEHLKSTRCSMRRIRSKQATTETRARGPLACAATLRPLAANPHVNSIG